MSIYPTQNIIDTIYRSSNNFRYNVFADIENSIFKSSLNDSQYLNTITPDGPVENLEAVHNQLNINGYISSNYLNHFQNKSLLNTYHVQDFVVFLNPPIKLLKKEDIILIKNRLERTKKIFISKEISDCWSTIDGEIIEPGIRPIDINTSTRKDIIILSPINDPSTIKIHRSLQTKYNNIQVISSINSYNEIMDILNEYKICINMGVCIDSIYAIAAGCKTICRSKINNEVYDYESIDHLKQIIDSSISNYNIKEQADISSKILNSYKYDEFEKQISKYIALTIMEPFLI